MNMPVDTLGVYRVAESTSQAHRPTAESDMRTTHETRQGRADEGDIHSHTHSQQQLEAHAIVVISVYCNTSVYSSLE